MIINYKGYIIIINEKDGKFTVEGISEVFTTLEEAKKAIEIKIKKEKKEKGFPR